MRPVGLKARPRGKTAPRQAPEGVPKIKGIGLVGVVRGLRKHRRQAVALIPGRLHHYLETRVLISSWYPEEDFLVLLRAWAEILRQPGRDAWHWLGRQSARADLEETYSVMICRGQPAATLNRFERLWRLYHDTGLPQVTRLEPGRARLAIHGYLFAGDEDFCRLMDGYFEETLRLAGAQGVEVRRTAVAKEGEPAVWQISWRES